MNLLPSLIYIKENISDYNDNPDCILENEIQRIIDSKDKYSIKSLKCIIMESISNQCWEFWRHHIKHSENSRDYLIDKEIEKEYKRFWERYTNIENLEIIL